MKLALEIPTTYLNAISDVTDMDFALAHMVLNDRVYRDFYTSQAARGRVVILDNGYYETNEPLPIPDLMEAARYVNPAVCIAPDKLGEPQWTFKQWETMSRMFASRGLRTRVGCNVTGRDSAESVAMIASLASRSCPWLFLPFREPRLDWAAASMNILKRFSVIHLLGVNTVEELRDFAKLEKHLGIQISVDTAKPLKFALRGEAMPKSGSLRGGGKLDHTAVFKDHETLAHAYRNIALLRKHMQA